MSKSKAKKQPKSKQTTDLLEMALSVCRTVVSKAEETSNCGVCGSEFDVHESECPYPDALEVLMALGERDG